MFRDIFRNIVADPHCIFCDAPLDIRTTNYTCADCADKLPIIKDRKCDICGIPLDTVYGDLKCIECKSSHKYFFKNVSRYIYKDSVRDAILKMKFGNRQLWIAYELGKYLSQTIKQEYGDINFDGIIYVPLSQLKQFSRKFNQSYEISCAVSKYCEIPILDDVLIKIKNTKTQSSLKISERKANIKDAYKVKNPDTIIDKTILLIDDVYTTGSTINECAKTLKKAGALAIYTATVAIVKHE